jgi:hypothetical protein
MLHLRKTTMGNRAALNRLLREQERIRTQAWIKEHYEPAPERCQAEVAREEADIASRRAAFPLH